MFTGLEAVEGLYLYSNQISHIEPLTFMNLTSLIHLILHNNNLTQIHRNIFHGLESLEELRLGNNQIYSIETGSFQSSPYLRILGLSGNLITLLTPGVFHELNIPDDVMIHPVELEISLSDNPVFCNWRLAWMKEAEVDGWVTWFSELEGDDGKVECINYVSTNTTWDDISLEDMKAG